MRERTNDYRRAARVAALWAMAMACKGYVPPRFAARPPVQTLGDTIPIAVPRPLATPEPIYLTEVYLHQPLRQALYISSYPEARDINSFDEVPPSSWFSPREVDVGAMARGPDIVEPPRPPFTVLDSRPVALAAEGFCVRDSRGVLYELAVDPPDRPEMRTGALAVAARLTWALGFNTPPVIVVRARAEDFWAAEGATTTALSMLKSSAAPVDGYYRLAALAWPPGKDLGPTPETGRRGDDPNDVIDHEHRRSLRSLAVLASWLGLGGFGPSKTLDRYVGPPGEGHVVHFVTGLDAALGASNVVRLTDAPPRLPGGGSPFIRFLTLGLLSNPLPILTQTDVPAIGGLSDSVNPAEFDLPLPYAPAQRIQAADGYWAARRIAELTPAHLALAIEAGKFSDRRAQELLAHALEARARDLLLYWYSRVVPLRFISFVGAWLTVRDEAMAHDLVTPNVTEYRLDFVDTDANVVAEPIFLHPADDKLEVALPLAALEVARQYLVVQITARRRGRWLPGGFEVHIRPIGDQLAVVGLRH